MRFRVGSALSYEVDGPSTHLFALKCIETGGQRILRESLLVDPDLSVAEFTLGTGMNRFTRVRTSFRGRLRVQYEAEIETSIRLDRGGDLPREDPGGLSPEALPYLFPSRYCQSDRLREEALDLFGHLADSLSLANGICDWIHGRVAYRAGTSGEQSSAMDTLERRAGVCRDFAHLGIALCRAMSVPARYLTCYSHLLDPPDFHAVMEVFIGGTWYAFDPTRLAPLNGLVRIATGRDAADAAVCTTFGGSVLQEMRVSCRSLDESFTPITSDSLRQADEVIALL